MSKPGVEVHAVSGETVPAKSISATAPIVETEAVGQKAELQEQIRRRAYELYYRRGGSSGGEVDDWLQAEAEVTGKASAANDEQKVEEVAEPKKAVA